MGGRSLAGFVSQNCIKLGSLKVRAGLRAAWFRSGFYPDQKCEGAGGQHLDFDTAESVFGYHALEMKGEAIFMGGSTMDEVDKAEMRPAFDLGEAVREG